MKRIGLDVYSLCEVLFLCGAYSSHEMKYYITCALSIYCAYTDICVEAPLERREADISAIPASARHDPLAGCYYGETVKIRGELGV